VSKTLTEVSRDAAELPPNEKLALARMLLDLADEAPEPPGKVEESWEAEIQRRIAEIRGGQVKGVSLEMWKKYSLVYLLQPVKKSQWHGEQFTDGPVGREIW
jgi:putative addiction module component (TIGR02574 family)